VIVEMSKVQVLGPRRLLPEALRVLHAQRVLHLRETPSVEGPGRDGRPRTRIRKVPLDNAERAGERSLEEVSRRLRELLLILPASTTAPAPSDAELPDVSAPQFAVQLQGLEFEARALNARRLALEEERSLVARYERLITALAPLLGRLERATHVETVGILVRRDRPDSLALVQRTVEKITRGACTMLSREVDREQVAVLLTVPRESAPELARLLFEQGIAEMRLPQRYSDQPFITTLGLLLRRSRELPGEIAAVEAELVRCTRLWRAPLQRAHRTAQERLARLRVMAECGETQHAFVISGWVPAERCPRLSSALQEAFQGKVTQLQYPIRPNEHASVPVMLRNPRPVRPFERLLSLLPPPRYGSIDPTPFLALSFPLFFGFMLGDVGYGLVALALALLARYKRWGGAAGRDLAMIATAAATSAIGFGLLFGELFGDLGSAVGLHPVLIHRRQAVLASLGLALTLGAAHVVLGLILGLLTALRRGGRIEALGHATTLALILTVAAGLVARVGCLPRWVQAGALAALGPLLVGLIVAEGVQGPLEVMKTLGNVLSYARLMALGLASVMLADVANQIAGLFATALVGLGVAALLHGVNFVMGCFSPVIQALRLHYVEFFGKFYQDGGRPYEPFALAS
jgi:V/A-type H+-transporting ATPase subunit I